MQLNIKIDPTLPARLKRVALYGLVPALVVIGATVYADVSVPQFTSGDKLSAATMNANFSTVTQAINSQSTTIAQLSATVAAHEATIANQQTRIAVLEATPTVVDVQSDTQQCGAVGANVVYASAVLTLTPGTWLIDAYGTMGNNNNDAIQLALYSADATTPGEVAGSRGSIQTATGSGLVNMRTSKVVTVSSTTTYQMLGIRNGGSWICFGCVSPCVLPGGQRMFAVKLR